MNIRTLYCRGLVPSLILSLFNSGATAQIVDLGGPLRPGEARPPLFRNFGPFSTSSTAPPYTPQQVRHAYGFDQVTATGAGQTIAIVDAYGSQSAQKDLNTFCSYFGIASTTLVIAYPQGKPGNNTGWAQETSLDVQWAHVIAPNATILLVVAKSSSLNNLLGAVDYAVAHGASVVSMSWGAGESAGITASDSHFAASGVTFVASAGDNGEGVEWPAASPNVVSVGGTSLHLDSSGNYSSESAWSGSGGGISLYEAKPSYQTGWQTPNNTQGGWSSTRGVPDVSYLADPNTGVYVVYQGHLYAFGGTSVGAPQWAALVACSNSARTDGKTLGTLNSPANVAIYTAAQGGTTTSGSYTFYNINSSDFLDILSGSNGNDSDDFAAGSYDLITGLGSPAAKGLVQALTGY